MNPDLKTALNALADKMDMRASQLAKLVSPLSYPARAETIALISETLNDIAADIRETIAQIK